MRWASAHRVPVVPRGAGSGLSGGATAIDDGIVLSTEKMRDITVDPVTRTAVCQPGLFNAEVKKAVAEHDLWYPPDPSSFEICSIGGNIATNAGGLCCVKYGVTTDYVLGPAGGAGRRDRGAARRPAAERRCGAEPDEALRRQRGHARDRHRGDAAAAAEATSASTVVASFASLEAATDAVLGVAVRDAAVDAGVHGRRCDQRRRGQAEDGPRPRRRRAAVGRLRRTRPLSGRGRRVHRGRVRRARRDRCVLDRRPRRGRGVRGRAALRDSRGGGQGHAAARGRRRAAARGSAIWSAASPASPPTTT